MALDLSAVTSLPIITQETVGVGWVEFTLPNDASRADIYFLTNPGFHSYETGAPIVDAPIPADTWFLLWEKPNLATETTKDITIQVKSTVAGTTVYVRVN